MTITTVPKSSLKAISAWVDTRWCPKCHWEGMRRKPWYERVSLQQLSAHHSGFRWNDPQPGRAPTFFWKRSGKPSFFWKGEEPTPRQQEPTRGHPSGFYWKAG